MKHIDEINALIDADKYYHAESVLINDRVIADHSADAILSRLVIALRDAYIKHDEEHPKAIPPHMRPKTPSGTLELCVSYLREHPETRVMELTRIIGCGKHYATKARKIVFG